MDPQDEINAKIEELLAIVERAADAALSDLVMVAQHDDRLSRLDRAAVAEFALDYAEWKRQADGYRLLLRRAGQTPRLRVEEGR